MLFMPVELKKGHESKRTGHNICGKAWQDGEEHSAKLASTPTGQVITLKQEVSFSNKH